MAQTSPQIRLETEPPHLPLSPGDHVQITCVKPSAAKPSMVACKESMTEHSSGVLEDIAARNDGKITSGRKAEASSLSL
jgi:hypothetical protein